MVILKVMKINMRAIKKGMWRSSGITPLSSVAFWYQVVFRSRKPSRMDLHPTRSSAEIHEWLSFVLTGFYHIKPWMWQQSSASEAGLSLMVVVLETLNVPTPVEECNPSESFLAKPSVLSSNFTGHFFSCQNQIDVSCRAVNGSQAVIIETDCRGS